MNFSREAVDHTNRLPASGLLHGSKEDGLDVSFALGVIADHFAVPVEQVSERSVLTRDLGADSLDLVELTLRLENEFGIRIGDDESEECADVASVLRLLSEKLPNKAA